MIILQRNFTHSFHLWQMTFCFFLSSVIVVEKADAFQDGQDRPACSDKRQKLERSTGGLQVKQRLSGSTHTSLGKVSSLDLLSSAPGNSEQHASQPVPKSSNKGVSVAKSLSRISIGVCCHFHHGFWCLKCWGGISFDCHRRKGSRFQQFVSITDGAANTSSRCVCPFLIFWICQNSIKCPFTEAHS